MPKLLLNACPQRQEQRLTGDTGSPVSTGVLLYGQAQKMSFELGPIPPGNRGIGRIKRETRSEKARSPRSDAGSYITGADLQATGGRHLA